MSKPMIHARSSAKRFGGQPEDYIEIHDFMDSSKAAFPDNRHRALTHNSWFIFIVEKVFGHEIQVRTQECPTCKGRGHIRTKDEYGTSSHICRDCPFPGGWLTKPVSVRDVAEQHILEDFGGKFIPTVADYLDGMEFHDWMNNGIKGAPPSHRKISEKHRNENLVFDAAAKRRRSMTLD